MCSTSPLFGNGTARVQLPAIPRRSCPRLAFRLNACGRQVPALRRVGAAAFGCSVEAALGEALRVPARSAAPSRRALVISVDTSSQYLAAASLVLEP